MRTRYSPPICFATNMSVITNEFLRVVRNILERCGADDLCFTRNAECSNGYCRCKFPRTRPGPNQAECVSEQQVARHGEYCYESNECFYNLECINSTCTCSSDQTVEAGISCKPSKTSRYFPLLVFDIFLVCRCFFFIERLGSPCSTDRDCGADKNSKCIENICKCDSGYQKFTYYSAPYTAEAICLQQNQIPMLRIGNNCSMNPADGRLCPEPYYCSRCNSNTSICTNFPLTSTLFPPTAPSGSFVASAARRPCCSSFGTKKLFVIYVATVIVEKFSKCLANSIH